MVSLVVADVLVTPGGASQDGSAMIGYNADDPSLYYGVLYHYPATTDNEDGSMVEVYNWDTGVSIAYRACMDAVGLMTTVARQGR
jgi:hypothetical protein